MSNKIIEVQDIKINVTNVNEKDYICISDIAKAKSDKSRAADVIRNWLRNRSTLDFLTTWEQIYNPNFKVFESEHFKKQVGLLTFTPSVTEWCERTNAIGIYSKMGKNYPTAISQAIYDLTEKKVETSRNDLNTKSDINLNINNSFEDFEQKFQELKLKINQDRAKDPRIASKFVSTVGDLNLKVLNDNSLAKNRFNELYTIIGGNSYGKIGLITNKPPSGFS